MTSAQVELMLVDTPTVVYNTDKKRNGKPNETRRKEIEKEWKDKYVNGNTGGTIDLSGFTNSKLK